MCRRGAEGAEVVSLAGAVGEAAGRVEHLREV